MALHEYIAGLPAFNRHAQAITPSNHAPGSFQIHRLAGLERMWPDCTLLGAVVKFLATQTFALGNTLCYTFRLFNLKEVQCYE